MSRFGMRNARRSMARRSFSAVALILGLVFGSVASSAEEAGKISDVSGRVEIGRGNPPAFARASVGDILNRGDVVRTGQGGHVELQLVAGTVRLYENTLLRIPAKAGADQRVELRRGRSIFDVIKASVRDRFEVHTPEVVVSVKGTRFEVSLLGELAEVAVFRGTVGVRAPDADRELETLVRAGFAAIGASDVPFELDLSPRVDPWDSWAKLDRGRESAVNHGRTERGLRMREAAQSAARRSSAKELLEIATERNPELARKIEAMRKERLAKARRKRASGLEGDSLEVPASISDFSEDLNPRDNKGRRGEMNKRERNAMKEDRAADRGRLRAMEKIQASQGNFKKIESLTEDGFGSDPVQALEDPSAMLLNQMWDPTPDVSMLEVASLQTDMSYNELITIWYSAVEDLQANQPGLFTTTDLSIYESALINKLTADGLSSTDATNISQLIVSKIQK